jgi:hypothetical protein
MPPVKPTQPTEGSPAPRPRGRPRKNPVPSPQSAESNLTSDVPEMFTAADDKNSYSIFGKGPDPEDILKRHLGSANL